MVAYLNPSTVHAPAVAYMHTAKVPAGTELVFISGQVGMRPDGEVPATLGEQAEVVFNNLRACLAAHGLGIDAVVKITLYLVAGQDVQTLREVRQRHLGDHRPTSTAVVVSALFSPEYLVEVEAVAVKDGH